MDEAYTKAKIDLKDDLRQAFIVARYEGIKFLSGKKIFIYGILVAGVLALLSVVYLIFTKDEAQTERMASNWISFLSEFLILLGAALFSSVTLVSEFEERTSLMLFTKPIRKSSIFLGKFIAAYVLILIFTVLYYVVTVIIVAIKTGGFTTNIFPSFGLCTVYIFTLTGIAIFFSALMKKSSSATILTFIFVMLVPGIIGLLITAIGGSMNASVDLWFILDSAAISILNTIIGAETESFRDITVMFLWGLVPTVAGYYLFKRREV